MAETARAKDAQREGHWITYLIRARRCWNAGHDLANRAELQNTGGPLIDLRDAPRSWLLKFSVAEARTDGIRVSISCAACSEVLAIPLEQIPELTKPATSIGQLARVQAFEACTFCGAVGKRRTCVPVD